MKNQKKPEQLNKEEWSKAVENGFRDYSGLNHPMCPTCSNYMFTSPMDVPTLNEFVKPLDGKAPLMTFVLKRKLKKIDKNPPLGMPITDTAVVGYVCLSALSEELQEQIRQELKQLAKEEEKTQ